MIEFVIPDGPFSGTPVKVGEPSDWGYHKVTVHGHDVGSIYEAEYDCWGWQARWCIGAEGPDTAEEAARYCAEDFLANLYSMRKELFQLRAQLQEYEDL